MKVLIVGLGIGNLYKNIYDKKLFDIYVIFAHLTLHTKQLQDKLQINVKLCL